MLLEPRISAPRALRINLPAQAFERPKLGNMVAQFPDRVIDLQFQTLVMGFLNIILKLMRA